MDQHLNVDGSYESAESAQDRCEYEAPHLRDLGDVGDITKSSLSNLGTDTGYS